MATNFDQIAASAATLADFISRCMQDCTYCRLKDFCKEYSDTENDVIDCPQVWQAWLEKEAR